MLEYGLCEVTKMKEKRIQHIIPLEVREEALFKLMDVLDADSFSLFKEVVDLNANSIDKVTGLIEWLDDLVKGYYKASNDFEELNELELENYTYAARRFQMKRMLAGITTIYALLSNILLGIASFLLLNNRANKDFTKEIEVIGEKVRRFDEDKLRRIECTLSNCERLLHSKIDKYYEEKPVLKIKNS